VITRADIAELRRLLEERGWAWRRVRDVDAEFPGPAKSHRLWDAQQFAAKCDQCLEDALRPLLPDLLRLADERLAQIEGAASVHGEET